MYLRHTIRKKDGKVHRYWCLVRSVRVGRRVIQQTVAHLGELDEQGRLEARALAQNLIGTPEQAQLFDDGCRDATVPVRLKGIRIERSRQFGDVYLALALWRGTGLAELIAELLPAGKERVAWERVACVLVAARLCEPSSELHIAEDWYRRTALCKLLQLEHRSKCLAPVWQSVDRRRRDWSFELPSQVRYQCRKCSCVSAVTIHNHYLLETGTQDRIAQITQKGVVGRERDGKRATVSDVVLGQTHPNGRRNHYRPLLGNQLGRAPTHFTTQVRPVLLFTILIGTRQISE